MKKAVLSLLVCFLTVGSIIAQESDCDRLFIQAVRDNNISGVKLHLSHSWGNLNARDGAGKTGLMYAVETQNRTLVQFLLNPPQDATVRNPNNAVSNPNIEDNRGWTALMYAIASRNIDLLDFFLKQGEGIINVNHRTTGQRNTALHFAVQNDMDAQVKLLLENKTIQTTITDINGDTAFMIAVKRGNRSMIRRFGESPNFDVTQRPDDGVPPLLRALENTLPPSTIQDILDFCRDAIASRDNRGRGPFDYLKGVSRYRGRDIEDIEDMLKTAENRYKNFR